MFDFNEAIPKDYAMTERKIGNATVRIYRNTNADPKIRTEKLQEVTNMLYRFRCRRLHEEEKENMKNEEHRNKHTERC